ncbi:hypothetical protein PPACK8108_LOCUS9237 [Phakopsora pachyrhizi]|uniref:Uncharacterized protein n=1 Tax=Phakopsora pachyrhizi TaxID=170000 RepID=A0AAV0AXS0_PHAPC|nr:hypothetical protein PPACK8108_LOCUS9237 [Phakopsora pachyrhizi]
MVLGLAGSWAGWADKAGKGRADRAGKGRLGLAWLGLAGSWVGRDDRAGKGRYDLAPLGWAGRADKAGKGRLGLAWLGWAGSCAGRTGWAGQGQGGAWLGPGQVGLIGQARAGRARLGRKGWSWAGKGRAWLAWLGWVLGIELDSSKAANTVTQLEKSKQKESGERSRQSDTSNPQDISFTLGKGRQGSAQLSWVLGRAGRAGQGQAWAWLGLAGHAGAWLALVGLGPGQKLLKIKRYKKKGLFDTAIQEMVVVGKKGRLGLGLAELGCPLGREGRQRLPILCLVGRAGS